MYIKVFDEYNTEMFVGDAEDYLAENDYDGVLEDTLNKLETVKRVRYVDIDNESYYIYKIA